VFGHLLPFSFMGTTRLIGWRAPAADLINGR
jgi:hypothetical protein